MDKGWGPKNSNHMLSEIIASVTQHMHAQTWSIILSLLKTTPSCLSLQSFLKSQSLFGQWKLLYAPLKQRVRKAGRATDPQIRVYCDSAVSSHSQWGGPAGPDHERVFFLVFNGFPAPTDLVRTRCQSCQFSFALIKTVGMLKMITADSFSLQICRKGVMNSFCTQFTDICSCFKHTLT